MDYDDEERQALNSETAALKQVLSGVKSTKLSPDGAREKLAEYCQSHGAKDGFMKADPGSEERNIYHNSVKGAGGGGGDGGGCCVAS